jgi:hypothetical protein
MAGERRGSRRLGSEPDGLTTCEESFKTVTYSEQQSLLHEATYCIYGMMIVDMSVGAPKH